MKKIQTGLNYFIAFKKLIKLKKNMIHFLRYDNIYITEHLTSSYLITLPQYKKYLLSSGFCLKSVWPFEAKITNFYIMFYDIN